MERRLALRGRWIYSMEASNLERARLFLSPLCARDRRNQIKKMKFSFRRHGTPRAQLEMAAEPGYRFAFAF